FAAAALRDAGHPRSPEAAAASKPLHLTLWGPVAAGKTVLLAKLYLGADDDVRSSDDSKVDEWEIYPTRSSVKFFQDMRETMKTSNFFPKATQVGDVEGIEYLFRHRTGRTCYLHFEDRPGTESEVLQESTKD